MKNDENKAKGLAPFNPFAWLSYVALAEAEEEERRWLAANPPAWVKRKERRKQKKNDRK